VLWLRRGSIPSLDWLKWLFGDPVPAGAFVVEADMQRLRHQKSRKAILRKADLSTVSIWAWEKDPRTSEFIKAILAEGDPTAVEGWAELPEETRRRMQDVRDKASLEACLERAGMSSTRYYQALRDAERCGVRELLEQYLKSDGQFTTSKSRQSGLVAPSFFIPTKGMLEFRQEARRVGAEQKITSLRNLPEFDAWFLDVVWPKPHRGRRHVFVAGPASAPPQPDTASASPSLQPSMSAPRRRTAPARRTGYGSAAPLTLVSLPLSVAFLSACGARRPFRSRP
jgi:hypothetical protein